MRMGMICIPLAAENQTKLYHLSTIRRELLGLCSAYVEPCIT